MSPMFSVTRPQEQSPAAQSCSAGLCLPPETRGKKLTLEEAPGVKLDEVWLKPVTAQNKKDSARQLLVAPLGQQALCISINSLVFLTTAQQ